MIFDKDDYELLARAVNQCLLMAPLLNIPDTDMTRLRELRQKLMEQASDSK